MDALGGSFTPAPVVACYDLDLVVQDEPGLAEQIPRTLKSYGVQIETLATERREAPMCGGMLLLMSGQLMADGEQDLTTLIGDLEALSYSLMVDVRPA